MCEASSFSARQQAFRVIRWWATSCRFTLATWLLRPSTLQAHTTRPSSLHSRTSRTTSPRRRRRSHCPHSSIVGSLTFRGWGRQRAQAQDISSYDEDDQRTSRLAAYILLPEVYEPPSDDVLGPEGSSPGPAAVNTPAVRSKRASSTGTPETDKQRRVRESMSAATLAGEPGTQWDVSEDHSPQASTAVPRPTPKSVGYN